METRQELEGATLETVVLQQELADKLPNITPYQEVIHKKIELQAAYKKVLDKIPVYPSTSPIITALTNDPAFRETIRFIAQDQDMDFEDRIEYLKIYRYFLNKISRSKNEKELNRLIDCFKALYLDTKDPVKAYEQIDNLHKPLSEIAKTIFSQDPNHTNVLCSELVDAMCEYIDNHRKIEQQITDPTIRNQAINKLERQSHKTIESYFKHDKLYRLTATGARISAVKTVVFFAIFLLTLHSFGIASVVLLAFSGMFSLAAQICSGMNRFHANKSQDISKNMHCDLPKIVKKLTEAKANSMGTNLLPLHKTLALTHKQSVVEMPAMKLCPAGIPETYQLNDCLVLANRDLSYTTSRNI